MQETEIINVRLPEEVVNQLDQLLEKKLYKSRSELIRLLLREYVQEARQKNSKETKE